MTNIAYHNETIEIKLKNHIKSHYKSIRKFTEIHKIPYTTLDSVFRRGINNSSVSTINTICLALNISLEGLTNNQIIPVKLAHIPDKDHTFTNISGALKISQTILNYGFSLSNGDKLCNNDIDAIIKIFEESLQKAK